jgi:hypothetical protein
VLIKAQQEVVMPDDADTYQIPELLHGFFRLPSLMKDEDPKVYRALYKQVEDVVQLTDVLDQMMISDITNHFWEQQRIRRCSGTVINNARMEALVKILLPWLHYNRAEAIMLAKAYFLERLRLASGIDDKTSDEQRTEPGPENPSEQGPAGTENANARQRMQSLLPPNNPFRHLEETEDSPEEMKVISARTKVQGNIVVGTLAAMGLDESAIDMAAIQGSLDTLAKLEHLAIKHEIRRDEIVLEVERRRQLRKPRQRPNGKLLHKNGVDRAPPLPSAGTRW